MVAACVWIPGNARVPRAASGVPPDACLGVLLSLGGIWAGRPNQHARRARYPEVKHTPRIKLNLPNFRVTYISNMKTNPLHASRMFLPVALLLLLPAGCSKKPDTSAPKAEPKTAANVVSQENRDAQAVPNDQQTPPDTAKDADLAASGTMSLDNQLCDEGQALVKAGRNEEAREKYEDALLLNPKNASALSSLAKFKVDDGDWAGAKEYLLESLSADPKFGPAWNNLAVVTMALGGKDSLSQAADYMRQAVSLKPDVMAFQMNLGNVLLKAGRAEEAIPYLKAASDTGKYPTATANLGIALLNAGHVEESIPYLKAASDTGKYPAATTELQIAEEAAMKNLIQRQINPTPPTPQPPSE